MVSTDHSQDEIYIPTSEVVKDQTDTTQETGRQQVTAVIVVISQTGLGQIIVL